MLGPGELGCRAPVQARDGDLPTPGPGSRNRDRAPGLVAVYPPAVAPHPAARRSDAYPDRKRSDSPSVVESDRDRRADAHAARDRGPKPPRAARGHDVRARVFGWGRRERRRPQLTFARRACPPERLRNGRPAGSELHDGERLVRVMNALAQLDRRPPRPGDPCADVPGAGEACREGERRGGWRGRGTSIGGVGVAGSSPPGNRAPLVYRIGIAEHPAQERGEGKCARRRQMDPVGLKPHPVARAVPDPVEEQRSVAVSVHLVPDDRRVRT
jgi:hypothetical protein